MFADIVLILLCVLVALYGAWQTVHIRHNHMITQTRRSTDVR
jgi:hypothetical protein